MEYSTLLFEVRDNVAHITLNRPEAANALNTEMGIDLLNAIMHCDEDPAVRAVLITGTGSMFCSGGDLKGFATHLDNLAYHFKKVTIDLHAMMARLSRMDAPVIAAVNGTAAGAGMSLVCASDIVLSAESARFILAYTRAGLTPDGASTYFLPRIVGLKRALELALTNRMLSAQEALEWGIINKVVPDVELLAEAEALATQLAAGPTKALGGTKRLLRGSMNESLESQMENESQSIANMGRTADTKEGITAFIEKRPARFTGQ